MYTKAKRHNKPWSPREVAIVRKLHRRGKRPEQIARRLQRTRQAIYPKLVGLDTSRNDALVMQKLEIPAPAHREKRRVLEVQGTFIQGIRRPILLPYVSLLADEEGYTIKEY